MSINVIQSQPKGSVIFTSSQNWTVPSGVHWIKVLAIGGGGGGGGGYSSTYVGGGGSSGGVTYGKISVEPGTLLQIIVGAGGSPGAGGSSPTAGGNGGGSGIQYNNLWVLGAAWGNGGGAATSSANGAAASGNNPPTQMLGINSATPIFMTDAYATAGNPASGQNGVGPNFLAPGFDSTASNLTYGYAGIGTDNGLLSYGDSGVGGGVNANGTPGTQGVVVIWWGD